MVQLSSIDLNLLLVLHALLETGSVKLAAARLSLSPSATSHSLRRLRELLDDPVLVRAGRNMVLSTRAEGIRARVRRLVEEIDGVFRLEVFDPKVQRHSFTLANSDYSELLLVAPLSRRLAVEAPGIDLYSVAEGPDRASALREGVVELDLGVVSQLPEDIQSEVLFEDRFVLLVREGHPIIDQRLTVERYAALEHLLVAPRGAPTGVVDRQLATRGLKRRVARTVARFFVAPQLLLGSDYGLTISARVADRVAANLGLVRLEPPLELPRFAISMSWHRRSSEDSAHRFLREQIMAVARAIVEEPL